MRVAPLGAYFADDLDMVVEQAERSAVTCPLSEIGSRFEMSQYLVGHLT